MANRRICISKDTYAEWRRLRNELDLRNDDSVALYLLSLSLSSKSDSERERGDVDAAGTKLKLAMPHSNNCGGVTSAFLHYIILLHNCLCNLIGFLNGFVTAHCPFKCCHDKFHFSLNLYSGSCNFYLWY